MSATAPMVRARGGETVNRFARRFCAVVCAILLTGCSGALQGSPSATTASPYPAPATGKAAAPALDPVWAFQSVSTTPMDVPTGSRPDVLMSANYWVIVMPDLIFTVDRASGTSGWKFKPLTNEGSFCRAAMATDSDTLVVTSRTTTDSTEMTSCRTVTLINAATGETTWQGTTTEAGDPSTTAPWALAVVPVTGGVVVQTKTTLLFTDGGAPSVLATSQGAAQEGGFIDAWILSNGTVMTTECPSRKSTDCQVESWEPSTQTKRWTKNLSDIFNVSIDARDLKPAFQDGTLMSYQEPDLPVLAILDADSGKSYGVTNATIQEGDPTDEPVLWPWDQTTDLPLERDRLLHFATSPTEVITTAHGSNTKTFGRYDLVNGTWTWKVDTSGFEMDPRDTEQIFGSYANGGKVQLAGATTDRRYALGLVTWGFAGELLMVDASTGELKARQPLSYEYTNGLLSNPATFVDDKGILIMNAPAHTPRIHDGDVYEMAYFQFPALP